MKLKKLFCVGIAAVVASGTAAMLAGCNDGTHDSDGKLIIKIGMWPENTSPADVAMFEQWEAAFEKDYPEYNIVGDPYTYSSDTVVSKATSGKLPTVFQTYFTEPQKLISSKFIADITEELKELKVSDAPDAKSWYDVMDPAMREAVTSDGKVYGVPRDGYGLGLCLNLNMLYDLGEIEKTTVVDEKTGAEKEVYLLYKDESGNFYDSNEEGREKGIPAYPTTFDDVRRISEKVVEGYDEGHYGLVVLSADKNGGWQFSNIAWNFGSGAFQTQGEDGKWTARLNSDGAVDALEWIQGMAQDGLISPGTSYSYADWYREFGSGNVAMAICGNDALMLPMTNYDFNKDDLAFVPMPTGDGESHYSLYGGTPYVFASNATKEQIKGALLFLKYMGRSPVTDQIALDAMELGQKTAQQKNMPILPTIKPWINEEYLQVAERLESEYVNVNMEYFYDFFNGEYAVSKIKRSEEPNNCQDMYAKLDNAIQEILARPDSANARSELTTANTQFQQQFLDKIR